LDYYIQSPIYHEVCRRLEAELTERTSPVFRWTDSYTVNMEDRDSAANNVCLVVIEGKIVAVEFDLDIEIEGSHADSCREMERMIFAWLKIVPVKDVLREIRYRLTAREKTKLDAWIAVQKQKEPVRRTRGAKTAKA
jgi:hypothetical protein